MSDLTILYVLQCLMENPLGNERGPLFMPTGHLEATLPDESAGQEQYNELGFILELLWRRKYLVAAFCAVGLLVG